MSLKPFPDIAFPGHQRRDDYAYGKFSEDHLQEVLDLANWLGWRYANSGIRNEYNGSHVIMIDTDEVLESIPGYREAKPKIEHAILRHVEEDGDIYITFSSRGLVPPFSESNLTKFIDVAKKNGIKIAIAS